MISRLLKFNPLTLGIWGLSQNALNVVINQTRLLKSRSDSPTPNLIAKEHNLDNETAVALRNHKATLVGAIATLSLVLSCVLFMPAWSLYLSGISSFYLRTLQILLGVSIFSGLIQSCIADNEKTSQINHANSHSFDMKFETFVSLVSIIGSILWLKSLLPVYLTSAAIRICKAFASAKVGERLSVVHSLTKACQTGVEALSAPILWHSVLGVHFNNLHIGTAFIIYNTTKLASASVLLDLSGTPDCKEMPLIENKKPQETIKNTPKAAIKILFEALGRLSLMILFPDLEKLYQEENKKSEKATNPLLDTIRILFQPLGHLVLMIYDTCMSATNKCLNLLSVHSISASYQAFVQAQGLNATKSKKASISSDKSPRFNHEKSIFTDSLLVSNLTVSNRTATCS